jgi:hypothetical protein
MGRFGIGARGSFNGTGYVSELDTKNLGLKVDLDDILEDSAIAPDWDGEVLFFSAEQKAILKAAKLDDVTIQKLDYLAREQGVDPNLADKITDLLATIADAPGGGELEKNNTSLTLRGFQLVEVPVSYGHPISESLAIGVNLKMMQGRVYGHRLRVFDSSMDDIEDNITEYYKDSSTFGLDVGALARTKWFNFGVVARNINSPTFAGFTHNRDQRVTVFPDVTLKPQVTVGAAFIPTETLTLAADYDLTKSDTIVEGYKTQNLNLGVEWDVLRFLALRGGASKNLAQDDSPWIYSAGFGVNLWAVRFDVAGAISDSRVTSEGDRIPTHTRFAAQVSIDF